MKTAQKRLSVVSKLNSAVSGVREAIQSEMAFSNVNGRDGRYVTPILRESLVGMNMPQTASLADPPSATFVISTPTRDRMGDILVPEGCSVEKYSVNPIWLLNHDHKGYPIGVARSPASGEIAISINTGVSVTATCYFHLKTDESRIVYAGVREGWLNACSVGFLELEPPVRLPPTEQHIFGGYKFNKWELLEVSIVGVPANPDCTALRKHLEVGKVDGVQIPRSMRKSLEGLILPQKRYYTTGAKALPGKDAAPVEDSETGSSPSEGKKGEVAGKPSLAETIASLVEAVAAISELVAQKPTEKVDEEDEEDEDEEDEVEEEMPTDNEEGEENPVDLYRSVPAKHGAVKVHTIRGLTEEGASCIRDAGDYLMEMADLPDGSTVSKSHRGAARLHGMALASLHKALSESTGTEGGNTVPEGGKEPEKEKASEEQPADDGDELAKAISAAFSPIRDAVQSFTGKRI